MSHHNTIVYAHKKSFYKPMCHNGCTVLHLESSHNYILRALLGVKRAQYIGCGHAIFHLKFSAKIPTMSRRSRILDYEDSSIDSQEDTDLGDVVYAV